MKSLLLLVSISVSILLYSCKENQIFLDETDNGSKDSHLPVVKMPKNDYAIPEPVDHPNPHSNYNFLGFGFDARQDFASLGGVRANIINIDKVLTSFPSSINSSRPRKQELDYFGAENSSLFMHLLSGFENQNSLFSQTLTDRFGSNAMDELYIYGLSYLEVTLQKHRLILSIDEIKRNYTNTEFKSDINLLDAESLVTKYGTHVITDISTCGKLNLFYQAKTLHENRALAAERGAVRAFNLIFLSNKGNNSIPENSDLLNYGERITYSTVGGAKDVQFAGKVSLQNGFRTENFGKWQETLHEDNSVFINLPRPGESLIPLYELVEDKEKSALIKDYVVDHLQRKRNGQ